MDALQMAPMTLCVSKVTLAAGSTTTISNTGTINYMIRGKYYTKSAMSNAATPTTDWATSAAFAPVPANYGSIYMVGLDSTAAVRVVQGQVLPLNTSGLFVLAPNWGGLPLDFCPIGYLVIKAGSTASSAPGWLFGTNNNSSVTGITYTFGDLGSVTDRPQIA